MEQQRADDAGVAVVQLVHGVEEVGGVADADGVEMGSEDAAVAVGRDDVVDCVDDLPQPLGIGQIRRTQDLADHPEYNRVTIRQVQVFDGILTTQEISLVPSPGAGVDAFPDVVYDTPDQGL